MALKTLSATPLAVASGAGDVEVTFLDDNGFYTRHTSTSPTGLVDFMPWPKGVVLLVTVPSGQHLHIRGRGTAMVNAISATEI